MAATVVIPGPRCLAAIRNTNYYEVALVHPKCRNTQPPVYNDGYFDFFNTIDSEGMVTVPDCPGLGIKYDWEFIEENKTGSVHVYE